MMADNETSNDKKAADADPADDKTADADPDTILSA